MDRTNERLRQPLITGAGFTVIEMLIVIAIVGILGVVAFPSYSNYVVKANRNAAQSVLYEIASRQERQLLDNRGYATSIASLLNLTIPQAVSNNYSITMTSPRSGITTPSYLVTATPTGNQLARDIRCGTLTLDENGAKTESGTGTVQSCWEQ